MKDLLQYQLKAEPDLVKWKQGKKGLFTVQSAYNAMTSNGVGPDFKYIWKSKIPPKIKNYVVGYE